MNKLSKLTALLLAIVLALGVPLGAMAESAEIETKTEYYEVADQILQAMIMSYQTYGEYKSMAEIIADEDFAAFLEGLPEDKLKKLANYVNDMFWAACIPYTNVGPFMPAVDVTNQLETASTFSLISRATTDEETVKGLYLDKTATGPDANGQYTITLEAYVTGQVTTSTVDTFTPVDVVLVLDTSGSMAYDVSSDDTRVDYEESRRFALQQGVNTFIDQVAKQSENANHRISIVEYDRANYSVLADWSFVDTQDRVDELKGAVDTLDASGGTRPGRGLKLAYDQLTDNYKAPQGSTERKKIVVLFTDGIPSANYFQADFAAEAIETAYLLKANPAVVTEGVGATLYSIAIFPGADPATPVSTWTSIQDNNTDDIDICNAFLHAVSSNYPGARASYYGRAYNNSYGNKAPAHGLNITPGTGGNNGYYLTADSVESMKEIFTKISDNIQSSHTSSTLTETTVVKDVLSPYFELPTGFSASSVTVQTADYKGTKDANGNLEWDDPVTFNTGEDGISFGTDPATGLDYVNVKNFGFNDNYVADVDHVDPFITNDEVGDSNVFYGRKLIISFKVEPTDGFLGGNGVVTNDPSSGIYQPGTDEDGNPTLEPVEKFPEPEVDVDVPDLEILAADQHIYLGNLADLDELLQSFSVTYNIVDKDTSGAITDRDGEYTVDTILNYYTNLTFYLKDSTAENANILATYTITAGQPDGTWTYNSNYWGDDQDGSEKLLKLKLTEDTPFYITYEAVSANNTTNKSSDTLTAWVYVYEPEVTFQDSVEKYMDTMDEATETAYYEANNKLYTYSKTTSTDADGNATTTVSTTNIKWYHTAEDKTKTEAGTQMSGLEPELTFAYTEVEADEKDWLNSEKKVTATEDVEVTVTTTITGDTTLTATDAQIKYIRNKVTDCPTECDAKNTYVSNTAEDPAFVIHITDVMSSLTISKVCSNPANAEDTFIFTITGTDDNTNSVNMQVVLKAGESVTINNLLIGSYKVTEDLNWSWRYKLNDVKGQNGTTVASVTKDSTLIGATLSVDADGAWVTFTNKVSNPQWLDGSAYAENVFSAVTTTTTEEASQ